MQRTSLRTLLFGLALFASLSAHVYATDPGDRIVVTADKAAVKSGSTTVGHVPKGNILKVYEVSGDWYSVRCTEGHTFEGWIHRRDVIAFENALEYYNTELANNPTAVLYAGRAAVWAAKGERDVAVSDLTDAIRLNPSSSELFRLRGRVYRQERDYDRAIADFTKSIRLNPRSATPFVSRGIAYFEKGDYDRAIADYTEAMRLNPVNVWPHNNRGNALKAKGDYDLAIADYNEAIRVDPKCALAFRNRGNLHYERGDYDSAIADYDDAIRLNARYTSAFLNRGNAFYCQDDYDRAIADYTEALRLDPQNVDALNNRGAVHKANGDYDRAIVDLTAAIRLNPEFTMAYRNRGRAHGKLNNFDRQIADYRAAVRIDPADKCNHTYLAWALATCPDSSLRDGEDAVRHAIRACELSDWKYASFMSTLAAAYAEAGDFDTAVRWQQKAIELAEADDAYAKSMDDYHSRLALYESGQPYHESTTAAPAPVAAAN